MQNNRVQPFSRFVNWFHLHIKGKDIYKYQPSDRNAEPPEEYFIRHDGEYYFLNEREDCQLTTLKGDLLRRVIERSFREALREQGFSFKGWHGYIAYHDKTSYLKDYSEIFTAHTGFEFRVLENWDGDSNEYYLVVDPHVVFMMRASIDALTRRGSNLTRLENQSVRIAGEDSDKQEGIDGFLLETLAGAEGCQVCRIINVRTNEQETVDATRVYLEPRPEIIRLVLLDLGIKYDVVGLAREKSFLNSSTAARDRFKKTQDIVRDFLLKKAEVFPLNIGSLKVSIEPDLTPVAGAGYPQAKQLPEPPILVDKSDSSAVHLQPYWGLRTFGPFTKNKSEIRLSLLGTKAGITLLRKLIEDMNRGTSIMPGGMRQFFNTKLVVVDEEQILSESVDNYVRGADSLGSKNERRDTAAEVTLVHLAEETSDFELNTPYYNVKPVLLNHGLASQAVTQPALGKGQWIHANLASAIFAKARGYPWVLANNLVGFDMILGIGLSQAISKTTRAGAHPRYIGYTNVFDEQGRWMFFESTSQLYDSDNREDQLADVISKAVTRFSQERGKPPRSVAMHYYQRFSEEKMRRVNAVLKEKAGEGFRVAYIAIDKSHPSRLYDIQTPDGSFPRAHYAQISEREVLLSTTGHTDLAKKRLGTPAILKITIDQYPEPFVSADDITNQVLALTRLNYKTLTPVVGDPVTLLFSNLVAKFTAVFSETQWKGAQNAMSNKINTTMWFL
ncbi:MAG TPA: Piwi domain-containing protein [Pyrinomonadaceae bacterium]|nr:Piwi domain-containing protein [Pyrinomonadaceae bacterium]